MVDYFSLLKTVLLKTRRAYNPGNDEMWNKFQEKVDVVFPDDYKMIINYYGTGGIDNFLWFLTPFELDENVNYICQMNKMLDAYKESKYMFHDDFPYRIFPDKNGLLPWGYTDNGDELYWKTSDKHSDWEIVIYESRSVEYYHYKMGIAEFLYKLICKEIECDVFTGCISCQKTEYCAIEI